MRVKRRSRSSRSSMNSESRGNGSCPTREREGVQQPGFVSSSKKGTHSVVDGFAVDLQPGPKLSQTSLHDVDDLALASWADVEEIVSSLRGL